MPRKQPRLLLLKLFQAHSYSKATHLSFTLIRNSLHSLTDSSHPPGGCNSPEPPDLPSWLRDSQPSETTTNLEDGDFIIPPLAKWADKPFPQAHSTLTRPLVIEEFDPPEINKLCKILNIRYPSVVTAVEALNAVGVEASTTVVSQLLKRFSNDWILAFAVFSWAKDQTGYVHSPALYDFMVDILGKGKQFSLMWDLVREMNVIDGYVSLVTMSKVMRRLARAGKYDDAVEAFRGIDKFGVSRDVEALNVLMDALLKEGSVECARDAFVEFKDCVHPNAASFNILVHGYCKARMLDDARKVMDEMQQLGFRPNVVTYTCFIETYCKMRHFREVFAIMKEMEEKGCKANVITYTIVMHAFGKAKQINKALEVYEGMKRDGCEPDASCYSSLIFALGKSGRLKDAWDVFEDMEKQGVKLNLLVYNTMISSLCAHLQEENALKLLERMEEDFCKPDIVTYAPLLKMSCRMKRMKVLKFLLNHMFKNDVSMDLGTYTLLVEGLSKSGKLKYAGFFFSEMVSKGMVPRDRTYSTLLKELEGKNMAEIKEKVERLMSRAQERKVILF